MLIEVNISYNKRRSHNTNWNIKILTMKEFSINENDFKIDIHTDEFWLNIREKSDFDFRVISVAIITVDFNVFKNVNIRNNNWYNIRIDDDWFKQRFRNINKRSCSNVNRDDEKFLNIKSERFQYIKNDERNKLFFIENNEREKLLQTNIDVETVDFTNITMKFIVKDKRLFTTTTNNRYWYSEIINCRFLICIVKMIWIIINQIFRIINLFIVIKVFDEKVFFSRLWLWIVFLIKIVDYINFTLEIFVITFVEFFFLWTCLFLILKIERVFADYT